MSRSGFQRAVPAALWLGAILLLAPGCANEPLPTTYAVKGKVVFKNGKPMQGGMITFMSVADPELRGYGQIAKDGTFTLGTIAHTSKGKSHNLDGVVEGDFHVNIMPGVGGGGGGDNAEGGVGGGGMPGGGRPFTLKKTYKIAAKEVNEITVVVE